MQLTGLDVAIVLGSLVVSFIPVLVLMRRAGRGTDEFFVSGRAAPWWLIGVSMVATTFSTDTPNLVTDFVRTGGVAKNWLWWAFLLTGMSTVFFFASLWRRSGVLTDLEFYELRYSGPSAAFLRGFRALYLGLFFNCVIMATVTLAAAKIGNVMLGWDRTTTVVVTGALCVFFGSFAGLWGVLTTDAIQFGIAMFGVIAAAVYAVSHEKVGGLAGLVEKIDPQTLSIFPDFSNPEALLTLLILPLTIQWWSSWYPGAEPGGGSYIAQRMLAARSERDAIGGTLFFNLAHYALRPWPWILVALASMIVFPTLDDIRRQLPHVSDDLIGHDLAYPAMLTLLPPGLLGLVVASLLAAYISTMTTHMNWGASYLVNDLYRRFMLGERGVHRGGAAAGSAERHLVLVSRIVSAMLVAIAGVLAFFLTTAKDAFQLLLSIGSGTGSIYLLRWYWWRVNAWSEIAAMAASLACAVGLYVAPSYGWDVPIHRAMILSVAVTTVAWVLTAYLTPPTDRATLVRFWQLVRPPGPGWAGVRREAGGAASPDRPVPALLAALAGCATVYGALFSVGALLLGQYLNFALWLALGLAGAGGLIVLLPRVMPKADATNGPAR